MRLLRRRAVSVVPRPPEGAYACHVPEAELRQAIAEENVIWAVRVTLEGLRESGQSFDAAWYTALQRLRIQPNMTPDEIEELIECKAWLLWSRTLFEWAYERRAEAPPRLMDGEVFSPAEATHVAEIR